MPGSVENDKHTHTAPYNVYDWTLTQGLEYYYTVGIGTDTKAGLEA